MKPRNSLLVSKFSYVVMGALSVVGSADAAMVALQDVPLYLSSRADPNILINMSVETPMGGAAYTDQVGIPAGCAGRATVSGNTSIGTCYFPTTTYRGYFDPNKCYTYSSTDTRFNSAAVAGTNHTCSSQWSGNFLNWATMTAIDMFIQPMTGGPRVTDTTSVTVLQRARKQDNNSWFPIKAIGSGVTNSVAASTVTPYSDSILFIYNTTTGFRIGTNYSNVVNGTGSSPNLLGTFESRVQVCNSAAAGGLEANCAPYGSYHKPEGLIQRHALSKRFGVMSYTLDPSRGRDGGVLRSNMKYVGPRLPNGSVNPAREYGTDGLLINNPDGAGNGLNSGVINYINYFSVPGYKSHDPISELFYEGIRYFKNLEPTPEYTGADAARGLTDVQQNATDSRSGGFWFAKSANDWQDPIQYKCQKNFVVAINDANPWMDKRLPGTHFTASSITDSGGNTIDFNTSGNGYDFGEPSNPDTDINVTDLTNTVGGFEGLNNTTWSNAGNWTVGPVGNQTTGQNDSVGGGPGTFNASCAVDRAVAGLGEVMGTCPSTQKHNTYYIAGLAYYANTTDLRIDFDNTQGIQNLESFIIDTQEYSTNPLDGNKNMLWLAGKYGGFTDSNGNARPDLASEWDANNDGIPDNYVLATNPDRLVAGLSEAFTFIDSRTSSASSASLNAGSISSSTRVYQARFRSGEWSGELLSYSINPTTGALAADTAWINGASRLPAHASRRIITVNSNGSTPVAFTFAGIDDTRKAELDADITSGGVASLKLNYLRGDAVQEATTASPRFRSRPTNNKMGDIISSSPVFVGQPAFEYPDAWYPTTPYSTFKGTARSSMIYVGANDGMLHAFNAATGLEEFAFVPGSVFKNLHHLTNPNYGHKYFVDGTPQIGDVHFNGAWQTVLVGGLNKGGQGVYALNVTNPTNFTTAQTNPGNVFLWEFTDANDADLGYTFGQPQIVRLRNGLNSYVWAAVFGNGYNNTEADGNASTTGYAYLYIVNIETGQIIRKLSTGASGSAASPNGLATPAMVDINGDGVADYAYAGDLNGYMWKFDLRNTDPNQWDVAFRVSGTPAPFFVAQDAATPVPNTQPITQRPTVIRGPNGVGMMVLFGTGKYLENGDTALTPERDQTFYGIWDKNTGTNSDRVFVRSELTPQTITNELTNQTFSDGATTYTYNLRVTSANPVDWSVSKGWYMDLRRPVGSYQAEKSVSNPIVRNGRLIFTTLIPDTTPCEFGGGSWIMEMDALTGSRLDETPFDLNRDRSFDVGDWVTLPDGTVVPASGLQFEDSGILPTPGVVSDRDVEYKYTPGTSGAIQTTVENPGAGGSGRQSWRQVR